MPIFAFEICVYVVAFSNKLITFPFFQAEIPIYVNRLNSIETIVPYEYHK